MRSSHVAAGMLARRGVRSLGMLLRFSQGVKKCDISHFRAPARTPGSSHFREKRCMWDGPVQEGIANDSVLLAVDVNAAATASPPRRLRTLWPGSKLPF